MGETKAAVKRLEKERAVKGNEGRQNLDMIPDNSPDEIHIRLFWIREGIGEMKERIKTQEKLLGEAAGLLNGIQATLFEMRQGELFDGEDIETADGIECKNEVFGELRELLGNEQAEKVADYFSGSLVYFSKNIAIARKYQEIRKAFREGATYRDLSIGYGYTETHIRNIVHKEAGK
jgi:hypothetical protein